MIYYGKSAVQAGGVFAKAVMFIRKPRGHSNTSTSSTAAIRYTYNAAGDIVYDQDKGLTYSYNALGLVSQVLRADGTGLQYRYAADGTLVTSTETQAAAGGGVAVSSRVFYLAGDRHDAMSGETYVHTPFGATLLDAGLSAKHVGFHADHLGNIILAYSDLNGDGFVDPSTEVLEENRYYPYGLKLPVCTRQSTALPFAYNGSRAGPLHPIRSQEQTSFSLHLTTYRTMAPATQWGRGPAGEPFWGQVDPKAGMNYAYSPYSSMNGNPISYNDPHGDLLPALLIPVIAGALIGGIGNVGGNLANINSFSEGLSYFATGLLAGGSAVVNPWAGAAIGVTGNLAVQSAYGDLPDFSTSQGALSGVLSVAGSALNAVGAGSLANASFSTFNAGGYLAGGEVAALAKDGIFLSTTAAGGIGVRQTAATIAQGAAQHTTGIAAKAVAQQAAKQAVSTVTSTLADDGFTTLYRAVSRSELDDIGLNGFRSIGGSSYETGKLFTTSLDNASKFKKSFYPLDKIPTHVVRADFPSPLVNSGRFMADGMSSVGIPTQHLSSARNISSYLFNVIPK